MMRYLIQTKYTAEGAKGLLAQGFQARADQFAEMIASDGGTCEHYLYSDAGDVDIVILATWPDEAGARGVRNLMQANAAGAVAHARSIRLYEGSEVDAAGGGLAYRPPGG